MQKNKQLECTFYGRNYTFKTVDPSVDITTKKRLGLNDIKIIWNNTKLNNNQLILHIIEDWFYQENRFLK